MNFSERDEILNPINYGLNEKRVVTLEWERGCDGQDYCSPISGRKLLIILLRKFSLHSAINHKYVQVTNQVGKKL